MTTPHEKLPTLTLRTPLMTTWKTHYTEERVAGALFVVGSLLFWSLCLLLLWS